MAPPFASTKASLAEHSKRSKALTTPVQRSSNNDRVILKVDLKQMSFSGVNLLSGQVLVLS